MSSPGTPNGATSYSADQTRAWLAWLARRMQRYGQTVFLIEQLQPSWLARPRHQVWYLALYSLVFGLLLASILHLAWVMGAMLDPPCPAAARVPLWLWWVTTSVWLFAMGGLEATWLAGMAPTPEDSPTGRGLKVVSRMVFYFVTWAGMWLTIRWIAGDGYASWAGLNPVPPTCPYPTPTGIDLGLPILSAAYVALVYGTRVSRGAGVRPVEALGWSWRVASKGALLGVLAGLVLWVAYLIARIGAPFDEIARNLFLFLPLAAVGGFLFGGLSMHVVREKTAPNQGMRLSLRNAAIAAALFGPILGLVSWPVLIMTPKSVWQSDTFSVVAPLGAAMFGLIVLLIAFLWFGGMDVLRHATLRVVLGQTGQAPGNFARFLDHAVELRFVSRVGGGYMFVHRYLLEYFAAQDDGAHRGPG